ncbi:Hypp1875 [Branchiostoma lanceolatum]|uniref:Hypp1875 protein n=1 Tax=Branchiostoma lanceolatum TaxID=7740 RepID=A0A8J9ZLG7_BRALA|nr:Hypp1875 [Branchiostoma lanceolatum]
MEDVWPSSLSWPSGSNSVYSSCQSSCVDITMSELRPREEPAMPAPSCGKPGLCNGLPDISECRESQSSSNPSSELTRQACIHQGNHLNHTPCTYTTLEFEIQDFPPGLNRNAKKKQVPLLLSPCMVVLSLLSFVISTLSLGMICFDSVYFIWLNHYYGYISELGEIDWIAGIKLSLMVEKLVGIDEIKAATRQGFQLTRKCRSFGMWSSEHQKMLAPKLFYNMTTYALVRKEKPCMDNCDIVFRFLYHQHPDNADKPNHLRFRLAYNVVERTECNNKVFYSNYTPVGEAVTDQAGSSRETHVGTMTLQFYPETCGASPIWDNTIKVVDT